jgi:hypothetical protein
MTVHSELKSVTAVVAKIGAIALVVASLSACVVAPIGHGYRHHGQGHAGPVVVEAAPVVVAPPVVVRPAVRHGYPRYYRY